LQEEGPSPDKPSKFIKLARLSSVGLELGISVVIGWAFGAWLDRKLGTAPWLMIVFLLIGITAGFRSVYRTAREASRSTKESKD
jgi:ATP synthase protein I